jgi:hypothetical protein
MHYYLFGIQVHIEEMKKVPNGGSNFEIKDDESLKQIGLNETFYFRAPDNFSNDGPIENVTRDHWSKNDEQWLLGKFLVNNIWHGEVRTQFDLDFFHN